MWMFLRARLAGQWTSLTCITEPLISIEKSIEISAQNRVLWHTHVCKYLRTLCVRVRCVHIYTPRSSRRSVFPFFPESGKFRVILVLSRKFPGNEIIPGNSGKSRNYEEKKLWANMCTKSIKWQGFIFRCHIKQIMNVSLIRAMDRIFDSVKYENLLHSVRLRLVDERIISSLTSWNILSMHGIDS